MANINLQIPDNKIGDIVDAFAALNGWNQSMGITKAAFAKQCVISYVKQTLKTYRGSQLAANAQSAAAAEVDGIDIT